MNTPGNQALIRAFETMERDKGVQEDRKGARDKILESKHHLHAALRYIFMQTLNWRSVQQYFTELLPSYEADDLYGV